MEYKQNLEKLLTELDSRTGSDLHFNVGKAPSIRVDGSLSFLETENVLTIEDVNGYLSALLSEDEQKEFNTKHDLDFSFSNKNNVRLRGNAYIESGNPAIALRRVPKVATIDELKLPEVLKKFALQKQGFFLVVGPMGQGKSTTMAAMVEEINVNTSSHIVTIEDPIEFDFEPKKSIIDQREVGQDTESFDSAMKSIFREDVNVILIGEMRTHETIAAAVTAAETGHLVISTLHTNNAAQTIDRIIDSFPGDQQDQIRIQLAASLLGVLSQRLVPKINGGRAMVYELMVATSAVSNLIREKRTHEIPVLIETGSEHGMVDMNKILLDLVERGEVSLETALEYSTNPDALKSRYL
jgi:twitching motility protein PilT